MAFMAFQCPPCVARPASHTHRKSGRESGTLEATSLCYWKRESVSLPRGCDETWRHAPRDARSGIAMVLVEIEPEEADRGGVKARSDRQLIVVGLGRVTLVHGELQVASRVGGYPRAFRRRGVRVRHDGKYVFGEFGVSATHCRPLHDPLRFAAVEVGAGERRMDRDRQVLGVVIEVKPAVSASRFGYSFGITNPDMDENVISGIDREAGLVF